MSHVERLSSRIDATIKPLLSNFGCGSRLMLIDTPAHPNVGDTAILLGQLAFLRRALPGATVGAVAHNTYSQNMDEEIGRADLLLFNGGGNFGDLWPDHHRFRLYIIERFRHKPMLQFPQSISFGPAGSLDETRRILEKARRFTLLARDRKTHAFAERSFDCTVELCPDMAFAIGPVPAQAPTVDFACLLRSDKELLEPKASAIRESLREAGASFVIDDWIERQYLLEAACNLTSMLNRNRSAARLAARHGVHAFEFYARSRLRYGLGLLGRGRAVVTDRLHGYILATLLGRPRYIFDTLDGKLSAFHETWLAEDGDVKFMQDTSQLRQWLASGSHQKRRSAPLPCQEKGRI